ncbi:MAG: dihydroneopterin aldolase [Clostridiales bacterium]|nr:dihydroneopterin aldolase [Clostridiales bacterium]
MDRVMITNLVARGIIGLNEWEREKLQEIRINIELYGDFDQVGQSDDIKDGVNYRTVAKKVLSYAQTSGHFTVEALAANLARICLEEAGVEKVRMRVEKPGAVRFAESVGIEIERDQSWLK